MLAQTTMATAKCNSVAIKPRKSLFTPENPHCRFSHKELAPICNNNPFLLAFENIFPFFCKIEFFGPASRSAHAEDPRNPVDEFTDRKLGFCDDRIYSAIDLELLYKVPSLTAGITQNLRLSRDFASQTQTERVGNFTLVQNLIRSTLEPLV